MLEQKPLKVLRYGIIPIDHKRGHSVLGTATERENKRKPKDPGFALLASAIFFN